jgi:hypothetical protein
MLYRKFVIQTHRRPLPANLQAGKGSLFQLLIRMKTQVHLIPKFLVLSVQIQFPNGHALKFAVAVQIFQKPLKMWALP